MFSPRCVQGGADISEDCLYLNVWTPEWPSKSRKPVMLWIHGGGNFAGSGSEAVFDGESLAKRGVVLVSANYRLGAFGFLAHPELTAESPHHASGNYGLMDQVAAMKWVRDNIARFGGDPRNVTTFGESAGGLDINVLMTSPLAKGLYARLIGESGPVVAPPSLAEGEKKGLGVAATFKAGSIQALRAVSAQDLQKATGQGLQFLGPLLGSAMAQWATDSQFRCGTVAQLVWHSRAGNRSYQFQFSRVPPGRESVGAAHGSEIPYVFGTLSVAGRAANAPKYDSKDSAVSDQMQQYWTNFAKNGNPNGGSLPQWPKFDPAARAYIEFTAEGPVAREGLRRAACELFLENVSRK